MKKDTRNTIGGISILLLLIILYVGMRYSLHFLPDNTEPALSAAERDSVAAFEQALLHQTLQQEKERHQRQEGWQRKQEAWQQNKQEWAEQKRLRQAEAKRRQTEWQHRQDSFAALRLQHQHRHDSIEALRAQWQHRKDSIEAQRQRILATVTNINTADFKTLVRHPYLNYDQTRAIVNLRRKLGRLRSWNDLNSTGLFTEADITRLTPCFSFGEK